MSLYANPLLYLNLGGEMIYVLKQRLKAQKIDAHKSVQVLNEVISSFLEPKVLLMLFQKSPKLGLSWFRFTFENIALSSIMKLDTDSMNKLFDLMTMMVKYQFAAATGPREIILITLNHIDSLRDAVTLTSGHENITFAHRLVVDFYGELICNEIWAARNDCLIELNDINVRVSMLLKLGLQNENTSFNISPEIYNEKFEEKKGEIGSLKLLESTCKGCNVGSLKLFGDRVTQLGRNIYSARYGDSKRGKAVQSKTLGKHLKDKGTKAELGMLAVQLGTEENDSNQSFSLNLFLDDIELKTNINNDDDAKTTIDSNVEELENDCKIDKDYKAKLDNICADFDESIETKINLLQLLDETES